MTQHPPSQPVMRRQRAAFGDAGPGALDAAPIAFADSAPRVAGMTESLGVDKAAAVALRRSTTLVLVVAVAVLGLVLAVTVERALLVPLPFFLRQPQRDLVDMAVAAQRVTVAEEALPQAALVVLALVPSIHPVEQVLPLTMAVSALVVAVAVLVITHSLAVVAMRQVQFTTQAH